MRRGVRGRERGKGGVVDLLDKGRRELGREEGG